MARNETVQHRAPADGEVEALTNELLASRARRAALLRDALGVPGDAAPASAVDAEAAPPAEEALMRKPGRQVSWTDLDRLATARPEAMLEKWASMKDQARAELESGQRACTVLGRTEPWERAQYLAVRQSMVEAWQPQGGIELSLVEQMAQSYACWMTWLEDFHYLQRTEVARRRVDDEEAVLRFNEQYVPPRVSEVEYADRALQMAERFQRMYLRSLRALRDLRRYGNSVTIHNTGPMTVGGNQQVNVSRDQR